MINIIILKNIEWFNIKFLEIKSKRKASDKLKKGKEKDENVHNSIYKEKLLKQKI